jgi:hypothetical protein
MSNPLPPPARAAIAVLLIAALTGCHKASVETSAGNAAVVKASPPVAPGSTPVVGAARAPQLLSKKKPSLEFGDEPDHILEKIRIHP